MSFRTGLGSTGTAKNSPSLWLACVIGKAGWLGIWKPLGLIFSRKQSYKP